MMRAVPALIVVAAVLSGCAPTTAVSAPEATPEPSISAESPTPTPTRPTPTAVPSVAVESVDPSAYASQLVDYRGDGVDFDSPDGNVRCGIWLDYDADGSGDDIGPYAGCRPHEANYSTDPFALWGEIPCSGGELFAELPATAVCNGGMVFTGEDPANYTVGILEAGTSIAFGGFTCAALDAGTIQCTRNSDGAGFSVGRDSYRYF